MITNRQCRMDEKSFYFHGLGCRASLKTEVPPDAAGDGEGDDAM